MKGLRTLGLGDPEWARLARFVDARLRGSSPAASNLGLASAPDRGPVFVCLRSGGAERSFAWADGSTPEAALAAALDSAAAPLGDDVGEIDAVEICVTHSHREADLSSPAGRRALGRVHVGVRGLELEHAGRTARYAPTSMLAQDQRFDHLIERFASERAIDSEEVNLKVAARRFDATQLVVRRGDPPKGFELWRGTTPVSLEDVTEASVRALAERMTLWATRQIDADGRMVYRYLPSREKEGGAANLVRIWMAVVALGRVARAREDPTLIELVERSIDFNLASSYRVDDGLGLIEDDRGVRLGALALCAVTLLEHSASRFRDVVETLFRTIDHLWQQDGSFRTALTPAARPPGRESYPGQALLALAEYWNRWPSQQLLDRFMRSFRHYRSWHLREEQRRPAFVPWHTRAYVRIWDVTKDPELAAFVLEMNDWLLGVQQNERAIYPDLEGRFYDPRRARFGRPHAAATGAYLGSLVEAYRLALLLDHRTRAANYRRGILRGLRNLMQLQFADELDMFYVTEPSRVYGGIRTNGYESAIRIDNIHNSLMAVLGVLDAFEPSDYVL